MTIYNQFTENDIVRANPTQVTTGIWTGDVGTLTTMFTSSAQTASLSGQYYWNVYDTNPASNASASVQYAVAYGHRLGGGCVSLAVSTAATLATKAIYQQYRNLLLNPDDSTFTFLGNYNSDHIYVINIQRARLKETLDPGNWQISLTGTNGTFTFIDDSGQTLGSQYGKTGQVFNIVSGSLSGSSGATIATVSSSTAGGYGLVYPELGLLILSPDAINQTVGIGVPVTSSLVDSANQGLLHRAIKSGTSFTARSAETISSTHYFVRFGNKQFNYSNNPSFFNETTGLILNTDFIQDPVTYPTTIGFYNDDNELLAVAKLSRPIRKGFDRELLVKARLDF